jgi:hypothetical protein
MTGNNRKIAISAMPRVSTYGQTLDMQLEQLRGAGCTKIYREKVTGARGDRRELLKRRCGPCSEMARFMAEVALALPGGA